MPWNATRNYGGGAGKIYTNPWGAKTTAPKGAPMPTGTGKYGFGEIPEELRRMFGPLAGTDPKSAAEAKNKLDLSKPEGQAFNDQIAAYRRRMLQQGKNE
jgi:hypothetical protein